MGGGRETLFRSGYPADDPFAISNHSSYLQIVDLGDLDRSLSMYATGQSGHPYHPHYDDLIDPWRNHQYHPMLWSRDSVEAGAASHLRLNP